MIFFWSLTCNLAMSAGLLREPLITNNEDIETLDEFEIKSRRGLAWAILALEWCVLSIFSHKFRIEKYVFCCLKP
jgi:hypothetical protein